MAPKKTAIKRKSKNTVSYKPTFAVRLSTCHKRSSTKTLLCPLFPKKLEEEHILLEGPLGQVGNEVEEVSLIQPRRPRKKERPYTERKINEVKNWEKLRPILLKSAVELRAPHSTECYLCSEGDAFYRCIDCCPQILCYSCVLQSHALQPLHIIEEWNPETGIFWPKEFIQLRRLRVPELIPAGCQSEKEMTLIDHKGRTRYRCKIIYRVTYGSSNEGLVSALLKLGFWPLTPSSPTTAISLQVLSLLQCLTLECQTSAKGFVSALQKNIDDRRKVISRLKSILRGESLPEFRLFWHAMNRAPMSLIPDFKPWLTMCPACPKGPDEGSLTLAMDGNFGLVHKHNSGKTYSRESPMSDMYFLDQGKVDQFVNHYFQDTKDNTETCSQFQAASAVRSKNKAANLNVTGVFGSSCRHEVPKVFMDLRHGERLAYPVTVLKEVKENLPTCVQLNLLYDIACTLKNHLKKRKKTDLLSGVQLAIPVFHSYGHKGDCQITMNPRRMEGFGLTDGEQLERLWSYLRLFYKISKEQTPGHRKELLTMALLNFAQRKMDTLEDILISRHRKADQTLIATQKYVEKELNQVSEHLSTQGKEATLTKLKADEDKFLSYIASNAKPIPDTWKQIYTKELLRFYTLRSQLRSGLVHADDAEQVLETARQIDQSDKILRSFEKSHKFKRWGSRSEEYRQQLGLFEDDRRSTLLVKLHRYLVQKQYHYEVRRNECDGQAKANRVSLQVNRLTKNIRATVKAYNIGTSDELPSAYPSKLQTEDVVLENDIFTPLHPQAGMSGVPFSTRRKILDQDSLQNRCIEEMAMTKTEMRNCYFHFCKLHACMAEFLAQIDRTTPYGMGLHCIGLESILWLQVRLLFMWKKIKPYTPIPAPPEGYLTNLTLQDMQVGQEHDVGGDRHDENDDESEQDSSEEEEEYEDELTSDDDNQTSDVEIVSGDAT